MFKTQKSALKTAGKPLPIYYRIVSSVIRSVYYPGCTLVGHAPSFSHEKPTLYLCSHRNSAFDGYLPLKIAPHAQALASIQLLNNPIVRLFFTGIPVVRKKDKVRFRITANSFESPVDVGVMHIKNGGSLSLFPEGSSEWSYQPLPYQRGAARIIRTLLTENVEFNVIPLGLFYATPDIFASHVEVYAGEPIHILPRKEDESNRDWEKRIHLQVSQALDAVSVNCPDEATFHQAEHYAWNALQQGHSYAEAFLRYQRNPDVTPSVDIKPPACATTWRWLGFCLMFVLLPILLAAAFTASYADARNTVSFFKIVGGSLASLIWLPVLAGLALCWPYLLLSGFISAFVGYKIIQHKGSSPC